MERRCVLALGAVLSTLVIRGPALGQSHPGPERGDAVSTPGFTVGGDLLVQARNLVLDHAPDGWTVTDFIQVRNVGAKTLMPRAGGAVLAYPLPSSAEQARILSRQDGSSVGSINAGALDVHHPIPPGEHLFVLRYHVQDPFFHFELPGATKMVDVLLRGPIPPTAITGLEALGEVDLDSGESFVHFAGEGFQDAVLSITEDHEASGPPAPSMALALGFLLAGGGVLAIRSGGRALGDTRTTPELFLAIARLDEAIEAGTHLGPDEREALEARRHKLARRLCTVRKGAGTVDE
jgi:hypothetical protein